jgi:hypothetical protein
MADSFDIVPVGIDHESTVVVWMIMATNPRLAVVLGANRNCDPVECIDVAA